MSTLAAALMGAVALWARCAPPVTGGTAGEARAAVSPSASPVVVPMRRRQVAPAEGARLLVAWLRHTGNHGAWAAEHIDDFWAMFCRKYRIEHIEPSFIRSELAAMAKPGTGLKFEGRKRLAKARYEFIRGDLGRDRATVYYIGPVKKSDGKSRVASSDRPVAVAARPAGGQGRAAPSSDRLAA